MKIKNWIVALMIVASVGGTMLAVAAPQIATAAPAADCNSGFLGFPAWYRGLTDSNCNIVSPSSLNTAPSGKANNGLTIFIWHIGLNIVEIVLVAVAYISAFYTLYGGFLFIISRGKPEGAATARQTILDAIIGLIISMAAIAAVNFVVTGILK